MSLAQKSPPTGNLGWLREWNRAWDEFWFAPRAPHTLAIIRILCGAMLVYVHAIWLSQSNDFFGEDAWVDQATIRLLHESDFSRSYLNYLSSGWLVAAHQVLAMLAAFAMMVGYRTRIANPLAWFMTLMVCHRQTGALFGLDQVVMMLSMYCMLCPCGSVYSLDSMMARASAAPRNDIAAAPSSIAVNVCTRLLQVHLCIIYLFGGLSKMRGDFWWEGSAMWWSIVNYEYQSLSLVWLGKSPLLIAIATHATLFWETFYVALVWPRLTRPWMLAMAVLVHGGIGLFLGMPTFGFMMIVANLAFVGPESVSRLVNFAVCRAQKRSVKRAD